MIDRDLVLLGGGHTHVLLIRALAMRPITGVRVSLVSESTLTPYSGMLPGFVAGHYSLADTNIDLNQLCRRAGVRWIRARAIGLRPQDKVLELQGQADLQFDRLSVDIGSTPDLSVAGAERHAFGVKPISSFQKRWQSLIAAPANPESTTSKDWAVIGAGAGGVELVLAMAHSLQGRDDLRFHLVFPSTNILLGYPKRLIGKVEQVLKSNGVQLHPHFSVESVSADTLLSDTGEQLKVDQSIWCTGAVGSQWLADSDLACTADNFVEVNEYLQSISHPHIFAVGDIAHLRDSPRPKAGVYAVRQAPFLETNLRLSFSNQELQATRLQSEFLSMLSLGDRSAIATRNGLVVQGRWVWRWKNSIDQKFMRQFSEFRGAMNMNGVGQHDEMDTESMHCGGCGSKLGPDLLLENLRKINVGGDIRLEDASHWSPTTGTVTTQSIDGFRSFISNEYLFGKISANHAFSDIHAMGAQATTAQVWTNLAFSHQQIQQRDHLRMLRGVVDGAADQGAHISGGHSTEGVETHLGIVANGEVIEENLWHKGGSRDGDYLMLSKGLGTGIILAADMQGDAPALAVEAAYESMLHSNHHAKNQLLGYRPSAVTDVTGFGLIGHLLEMLDASAPKKLKESQSVSLVALLSLAAVPVIQGAHDLAANGWQSSLDPQLRPYLDRCEFEVEEISKGEDLDSRISVLLDPQTSGGLLISLPEREALRLIAEDSEFVMIGRVQLNSEPHTASLIKIQE